MMGLSSGLGRAAENEQYAEAESILLQTTVYLQFYLFAAFVEH